MEIETIRAHLLRAAEAAHDGMTRGVGGPFGATIVDAGGNVVAVASNRVMADLDPTAHAEVCAIRAAAKSLGRFDLSGCVLFATGEPCPMCAAAIHWARITRVYFANTIAQAAEVGFDDSLIAEQLCIPVAERTVVRMEHVPLPDAAALYATWAALDGKTHY